MWLFTRLGFFSVVRKENDDHLTIRSRTQGDLLRLCRYYLPKAGDPVAHAGTDYPWRVRCPQNDFAEALQKIAGDIDYGNFKNEVALSVGKTRAAHYGKVWSALYGIADDLQEHAPDHWEGLTWPQKAPSGKALAFGGVVIDPAGRVLLREVAGHFDKYVWSFAKGRADPGESPRAAALREVKEEMGVSARILMPLPSAFLGGTTVTYLFLMLVDPRDVDTGFRCKETAAIRWANAEEAVSLIGQTTNDMGRKRDLAVLAEALGSLPPTLHVRPIARREDWKFLPMPAERAALPYRREFNREEMARVVRGYIAGAQEEKWCAVFEDGELRLHRSWTGMQIFRLRLAPLHERPGHWQVEEAVLNRHPAQYGPADETEALAMLQDMIENLMLRLP
jgi:8-oxo-dGTP pyrophosphatase MutT (NUDIX family)